MIVLTLVSSAFHNGAVIPTKYTCDGEDISPPLSWSGAPDGTQSFVLVCSDPDAPGGNFHHWAIYDIPGEWDSLTEGFDQAETAVGIHQALNDFRKSGYGGPCPPHGHGPHRYHFRLSAVTAPHLTVSPSASCREVAGAAELFAIETAELVGVYER